MCSELNIDGIISSVFCLWVFCIEYFCIVIWHGIKHKDCSLRYWEWMLCVYVLFHIHRKNKFILQNYFQFLALETIFWFIWLWYLSMPSVAKKKIMLIFREFFFQLSSFLRHFNSLLLTGPKSSLTILMKSCRQMQVLENIWRSNVNQRTINNSPSNIL